MEVRDELRAEQNGVQVANNINSISSNTASFGVEISNGSEDFWNTYDMP